MPGGAGARSVKKCLAFTLNESILWGMKTPARKTEQDYRALQARLEAEEKATGLYLADENVDRENVLVDGRTERSADYWESMCLAAEMAAEFRREDQAK
jgi:hypothetical protein